MKNKFLQAAILAAITTVLTDFLLFSNSFIRLLLYVVVSSILFFLVIKIGFKIFLKKTKLTSKCLLLSFAAGIVNIFCEFLRIFVIRLYVPLLGYIITFAVFFVFTLIMYKHIEGDDSTNIETTTQEKEFYKKAKELVAFAKKHSKMCLSVATAAFVFFTISQIVAAKRIENYRTKLIESFADKIFISDTTDSFIRGYIFDEKGSYRCIYETGDIGDYSYDINVRVNWFGFGSLSCFCDVITYDENGNAVAFTDKEYDGAETVYKLSDSIPCLKHEFGEYVTLKEAQSCQAPGSKKRSCVKCGYEEISTVNGSHTYVNGYCSVCGQKEHVITSDVQADVWYKSTEVDALKVKNCSIKQTWPTSTTVPVKYASVCKHCHVESSNIQYTIVEFGVPIKKNYICPRCNKTTVVELTLN